MSHTTYTVAVPQQDDPLPTNGEVLDPMCELLLRATEALHNRFEDTEWARERQTAHQRDMTLLAARHVCQMMRACGLGDFDDGAAVAS